MILAILILTLSIPALCFCTNLLIVILIVVMELLKIISKK